MEKLVLYLILSTIANALHPNLNRPEDYSDVFVTDPNSSLFFKTSPTGNDYPIPPGKTYLSIPDSKWDLEIRVRGSSPDFGMFTNRKLYVGRNIEVSADLGASISLEQDMFNRFPWKMNTYDVPEEKWTGLESVEFGPQMTKYPYFYGYWPGRYSSCTMRVKFPFAVKRGALVRISSAMIGKPAIYNENGEDEIKRAFLFTEQNKFEENAIRVNYVISKNCCLLSGYELGLVQSYIKVEATNPPGVSSDFVDDTYENKLLIVPARCKEIYAAHEKWGKFRHILEESEPRAIESEETSKPEIGMGTSAGVLHIESEPAHSYGVEVYTADGQLVYRGNESTISVPRGVLIVRCGNTVRKIIN